MIEENTIYNDKEKEIIEQDTKRELLEQLDTEDLKKLIKLKEEHIKTIRDNTEETINTKRKVRRKLFIGVCLVLIGVLIILWASILILSDKPNIGFGLFATVMLCFFGGAVALRNNEM